jgi:exonuclease VII large subunit
LTETEVFRICVILAIVGLGAVYGSSIYLELDQTNVSKIDKSWTGRNVKVSGEVTEYSRSSGNIFFDLQDGNDTIKVVMFDTSRSLKDGDRVNVTGHVSIYQQEVEVIAREIQRS